MFGLLKVRIRLYSSTGADLIWISSNKEMLGVELSRLEVKEKGGGACINSRIRLSLGAGRMP